MEYDGKQFKSILKGDLDLDSKEEKDELERKNEESKDILSKIKALPFPSEDVVFNPNLEKPAQAFDFSTITF